MKWYTAIGMKKNLGPGEFCVQVGHNEKVLRGTEIYIWTALLWTFCEEEDIYDRVKKMLQLTFGEKEAEEKLCKEEYLFCLRRLCVRKLVICCEGETAEGAVMCIMEKAVLKPYYIPAEERWSIFFESIKRGRGLRFALKAFKRNFLEEDERKLLEILKKSGDIGQHLETLKNQAILAHFLPVDSQEMKQLQEIVKKQFLVDVITLYAKKLVNISFIAGKET